MTLYGELFDKEGETIWDELLYMLTHPELEEEKLTKERQEKAYIDYVLEKGFSDTDETAEPYMSFEDFVRGKGVKQGVNRVNQGDEVSVNNSLAPQKVSNPQNPYDIVNSNPNLTEEEKLSKILEVSRIQEEADKREKEINRQHAIEMAKDIGGAALEIGSAAVPGIGGAKVAGAVTKALAPKLGRKIANEIATGALKGLPSGFVEGLGRGLTEDENPFKTATQDSITGTVLGTAGGALLGEAQKAIRGNRFRKLDSLEGLSHEQIKKIRKDATNYYDDYLKGTTVKRKDMDEISFGNAGIGELRSKSLHNIRLLPDLKQQIKTGQKIPSRYDYERDDISGFEVIQNSKNGKTYEYLIAKDKANGNKFYMPKEITKTNSSPTDWDQHPGSEKSSIDIIPHQFLKNNPVSSQPQSIQPVPAPESRENWLERLKRERRKRGWF